MNLVVDHHVLAAVLLVGMGLDLPGGLYLAYDLLGQPSGPLRRFTALFTNLLIGVPGGAAGFVAVFFVVNWLSPNIIDAYGYDQIFGGLLGLGIGGGIGISLGYALNVPRARAYVHRSQGRRLLNAIIAGSITGAIGVGYYALIVFQRMSFSLALVEAIFISVIWNFITGWLFARLLLRRLSPALGDSKPAVDYGGISVGLTWIGTIVIFAIGGYSVAFGPSIVGVEAFAIGGGIIALVAAFTLATIQRIEWNVAHLPERTLGYFGLALVLMGFLIQSLQYFVPLLDIQVR
jgi:hypothetical protein